MKKINKIISQIKCSHFWVKGINVDLEYGKGYKAEFICARCSKRIERWSGKEPISSSSDPLRDKKDLRYNLSPPVIYIDRSLL